MLALVGTVMSRSPSGNVLLRDGEGVLGPHRSDSLTTGADGVNRARRHIAGWQSRGQASLAALADTPVDVALNLAGGSIEAALAAVLPGGVLIALGGGADRI
jgi:hypothetical protein